ncbi:MAG: tRNA (guanosine(37)-N1)-methyltransferase TrmD [Victivallales bacterium]|nr:tRNA (guanosine(37)-N1)-methyltransferase TrmD [Victivallales bacterium]
MLHRLDIVSLFPGISQAVLAESIMGRAQRRQLVAIRHIDLRTYADDKRGTVDDSPFGDGVGMLLKPEILFRCLDDLKEPETHTVLMCPQGRPFCQAKARAFAETEHLILFAGHYEGIDERARQALFDEELSLGDFVLTNGAIAAAVVADAVVRLLPGVLGKDESSEEESFGREPLLEYPHFTRPADFKGMHVPEQLLSGNHADIAEWRREQRLLRTAARRPDLFERYLE